MPITPTYWFLVLDVSRLSFEYTSSDYVLQTDINLRLLRYTGNRAYLLTTTCIIHYVWCSSLLDCADQWRMMCVGDGLTLYVSMSSFIFWLRTVAVEIYISFAIQHLSPHAGPVFQCRRYVKEMITILFRRDLDERLAVRLVPYCGCRRIRSAGAHLSIVGHYHKEDHHIWISTPTLL